MPKRDKLVIISMRLPVSISKKNGEIIIKPSTGGLATGMSSVSKSRDSIWIGWPGIASEELTKKERQKVTKELKKLKCHPVFLTQKQIDEYYSGYCNATLWPLFHYFLNRAIYKQEFWEAYKKVNAQFAKEVFRFVSDSSQLWVHDYQLMLLPQLLRAKYKKNNIGFFLHTPFPSYEIFRLVPEREELLEGLLGANLIGFHTYDYVRHFLSSVTRAVGYENNLGVINVNDRLVQADAFPIGIDFKKFAKSPRKRGVKKLLKSFNLFEQKTKIILSVDRSDYSKGIPARLDAFENFLDDNPDYRQKVVMIALVVPSRGDIEEYQHLRAEIEQKVSRINGRFSTVDWSPITYRYQALPFEELSALYAMADIMLVTPLRDGMNLVAKEYVATHHKDKGVLILSEMAGAASELAEAIHVNPYSTTMVSKAIAEALEMPTFEQKERMSAMQRRIKDYDISRWAEDFVGRLNLSGKDASSLKLLDKKARKTLHKKYNEAKNRLILLDYDGTLREFVSTPDESAAKPSKKLKTLLKKLSKDPRNNVVIVSGRHKNTLDSFFKGMGLDLVAEHGAWIFEAGKWIKSGLTSKKWKKQVKPIIEEYKSRTPGSVIEEKDFSYVWHYRNVSPDLAYVRSQELIADLKKELVDSDADVFEGNKIVEVKPHYMHKGAQVTEILDREHWDFMMAFGDDYTDEDMFRALPERAYTFNVGNTTSTDARFQLKKVKDVIELLEDIAN